MPAGASPRRPQTVALPVAQALAVLERAQLLRQRDAHVAVGADGESAAGVEETRGLEDAIAEVGLRDRAQAGNRARARQRAALLRRHVRAMDQAPARIDAHV